MVKLASLLLLILPMKSAFIMSVKSIFSFLSLWYSFDGYILFMKALRKAFMK